MIQGSDEWKAARLGKVTASRIADVVAKTRSGWGASRANYMAELVAERLTGKPADSYINGAMQWGIDHEAEARMAYEWARDVDVVQVGLIEHPRIPMSAASPDGLVGDEGLVEIKCPNTATHIDTLLTAKIPEKYVLQMQWQMACTGRKWCDFCSYDPRMPESMRLFIMRVDRDEKLIGTLEQDVELFLRELNQKVAALREAYEPEQEAA